MTDQEYNEALERQDVSALIEQRKRIMREIVDRYTAASRDEEDRLRSYRQAAEDEARRRMAAAEDATRNTNIYTHLRALYDKVMTPPWEAWRNDGDPMLRRERYKTGGQKRQAKSKRRAGKLLAQGGRR